MYLFQFGGFAIFQHGTNCTDEIQLFSIPEGPCKPSYGGEKME